MKYGDLPEYIRFWTSFFLIRVVNVTLLDAAETLQPLHSMLVPRFYPILTSHIWFALLSLCRLMHGGLVLGCGRDDLVLLRRHLLQFLGDKGELLGQFGDRFSKKGALVHHHRVDSRSVGGRIEDTRRDARRDGGVPGRTRRAAR